MTPARPSRRVSAVVVVLIPLGLVAGASSFWSGFYDSSAWVPIGLALLVLVAAALVARPARITGPGLLALGGFAGLAIWSLVSSSWSSSAEEAVVGADRWLVLVLLLALLLLLLRDRRLAAIALGAAAVGSAAVAVWLVAQMLTGDGEDLFLGGRLNEPLGYINAQGTVLVMAIFPCVAVAERVRNAPLAGVAASFGVLFAGLALLTASRGVALSVAVGLLVVFAACPGRLRRAAAVAVLGAAVAAAAPTLLDVYDAGTSGTVSAGVARDAATALVVAALIAGAVWALLVALLGRAGPGTVRGGRRLWAVGLAVAGVVLLGGAVAAQSDIRREAGTQYDIFVHLEATGTPAGTSRLASGAGNRYDYWRIAWDVWKDDPIVGAGQGGYTVPYFKARSTSEDIRQPHSIELQLMAELGLVGLVLLVLVLAGAAWGAGRSIVRARHDPLELGLAVGAAGAFTGWLVHTSVDWIHLLPGATAVALVALAVLLSSPGRPGRDPAPGTRPRRGLRIAGSVALGLLLLGAGLLLSRQLLAEQYRDDAQAAIRERPAEALKSANESLQLDGDSVTARYFKAAALARLGAAGAAEASLMQAVAKEPDNFLTFVLLGDLAVRQRNFGVAKLMYSQALRLNPRDPALIPLARNPRPALR